MCLNILICSELLTLDSQKSRQRRGTRSVHMEMDREDMEESRIRLLSESLHFKKSGFNDSTKATPHSWLSKVAILWFQIDPKKEKSHGISNIHHPRIFQVIPNRWQLKSIKYIQNHQGPRSYLSREASEQKSVPAPQDVTMRTRRCVRSRMVVIVTVTPGFKHKAPLGNTSDNNRNQ